MLIWRLAFRNLFRQKSRLALNLILLVGAFTAIVVFKGFRLHVLQTVKDLMVDTQLGHLQVAKSQFWDKAPVDHPTQRMIEKEDSISQKFISHPNIQGVAPRVQFYGLVNTETHSQPVHLIGIEPQVETKMQERLLFLEGHAFQERRQAILSSGLQEILGVKAGEEVTLVSPTLDGSVNAMDIKVSGIFKTGFADVDKGTIFLTVKDAQKILDTDHVEQLLIFLKNPESATQTRNEIQNLLSTNDLKVKSWSEISDLYGQVEVFYDFQNIFVECILILLLILSISNTMSMTVYERLGEIGTLRALGDEEKDIRLLIMGEAVLLGALAVLIATPFSYVFVKIISSLKLPLVLPMASRPLPIEMIPYWGSYIEASLLCFFAIVLASLWPAKKAAQVPIVTALKAKI